MLGSPEKGMSHQSIQSALWKTEFTSCISLSQNIVQICKQTWCINKIEFAIEITTLKLGQGHERKDKGCSCRDPNIWCKTEGEVNQ